MLDKRLPERSRSGRRCGLSILLATLLVANVAWADPEADMRRALIERQQRADELVLRLQQSELPNADARQQQQLDALHSRQLLELQAQNARRLQQFDAAASVPADPNASRMLTLQQQQQFERDRQIEIQRFRWEEELLRLRQREALH